MAAILIIDDDEQISAMMRAVLERDGHRVTDAPDGIIGVQRFAAAPADLVIVDLFMPRKDGWQTIRELQMIAPGVPCLVVSACGPLELLRPGDRGTLRTLRGKAACEVLLKPFTIRELSDAVSELLAASGAMARQTG